MTPPPAPAPRPGKQGGRSVPAALAALVLLSAALVAVTRAHAPDGRAPAVSGAQGRAAPGADARTAAVDGLLRARSRALLARDRAGFLAGVDPDALAGQAALFDGLAPVPLSGWGYRLDPLRPEAQAPGPGTWTVHAVLGVGLAGIDADPAESGRTLVLHLSGGRWTLAQDRPADDAPAQLWDSGPVVAVRGARSVVLGHPGAEPDLRRLAAEADAAVPRVTAVWGTGWAQRVAVLVPSGAGELARLVRADGLDQLAALTVTAPVRGGTGVGGDRVVVDPAGFARLGATGRRVVLTHEVLHVAARAATGDATPRWLREGLADHVGYLGAGVPVPVAASELADQVRAGRVPARLPLDSDLDPRAPGLAAAYEQAWLAVETLVRAYGQDRVLALYRDLGARAGSPPGPALDAALRERLGTTVAALTAQWQADLRRQLS